MSRVTFNKPALSTAEHTALLLERGMVIPDLAKAEKCLRDIGYYRLSAYWRVFQYRDGSEKHDHFRPGANFETVMRRYEFDQKLRHCFLDGIEMIEVAVRAAVSDTMSNRRGSHWFLDPANFELKFDHGNFIQRVRRVAGISPIKKSKQPDFIKHYLSKYSDPPDPPSWMLFEVISFGTISLIYASLPKAERTAIVARFRLSRRLFRSWLHAISHLRNLCAHHCRIWNRTFGVFPSVATRDRYHVCRPRRLYSFAVAMQTLLKMIEGDTRWADRLRDLLAEYSDIPLDLMGFPSGWEQMEFWGGSQKAEPA